MTSKHDLVEGNYGVDDEGYFGQFGGAFIPELLQPNISQLQREYRTLLEDDDFQREFSELLRDYVGRPTPLTFATRCSEELGFRLFLKREDLAHTGAHKINNALGQALLAKRLKRTRIIAETGAGQHGVATATVCALLGLSCVIYMGEKDIERQAPNVGRMRLLGAEVVSVSSGSRTLKDATNEAMRDWIAHPTDTHYIIGSVVGPHPFPDLVARLQSVIGQEVRSQLALQTSRDYPDLVVACVGGGSNAIGIFGEFLHQDKGEQKVQLLAVEAAGEGLDSGKTAATIALGRAGVLHGSYTLFLQNSDGQVVEPHSLSAGLDYPGIGPQHAHLFSSGRCQFESVTDEEAVRAAFWLSRSEGIIPALETAHALAAVKRLKGFVGKTVVVSLSGRGDKDMETYLKWSSEIDVRR
ncbi:MAG: tryptophan synthase subunit beta [Bdellovibrionales bacterium]|nr:tryptophan synthase subunit beta [Bdellovibrionales bacterium]